MKKHKIITFVIAIMMFNQSLMALSPPKVEDTFTIQNARNIMSGFGTSFVTIGADNSVWSYNGTFKELFTGDLNNSMSNVVKVVGGDMKNIFALDSYGDIWQLSTTKAIDDADSNGKFVKLNLMGLSAADVEVHYTTSSYSLYINTTNGELYKYTPGSVGLRKIDNQIANIKQMEVSYYNYSNKLYVLTERGSVYLYENPTETSQPKLIVDSGVKDIAIYLDSVYMLDYNGNVYDINKNKIELSEPIDYLISSGHYTHAIGKSKSYILTTTSGKFIPSDTKSLVSVGDYTMMSSNGELKLLLPDGKIDKTLTYQQWQNTNPIVEEYKLANISITPNSLLDRKSSYSIKFSLVANQEPKAFNLYYAKQLDVTNKLKWVTIESNVSAESLNPTEYATGYDSVNGKTYTYTWNIKPVDLTQIQLIIEPIY